MKVNRGGRRLAAAVVTGVLGLSLAGCGKAAVSSEPVAAYAGLDELPEKLGADGTSITVGDPEAPVTVRLYEDPRCPVVEEFELTGGASVLRAMTERREVKTEYTFASFRDDRLGGSGSKRAVNALRAALEEDKFAEYHAVLFRHQPEGALDGYTTAFLLELAGKVEGLRSPAFDSAVTTMQYRTFVTESEKAYEQAGGEDPRGPGTPTAVINGKQLPEDSFWLLFDKPLFELLLTDIQRRPWEWASGS
ncbi:thioredoxin domain-containing protein [Streptomyces sp. SYSU K217416]